jgi:hypothetical protein
MAASTTYNGIVDLYATFTASGTLQLVANTTAATVPVAKIAVMEIEPVF